jgi:hypothetical protein
MHPFQEDIYVILLDSSDIEFVQEEKTITIHNGASYVKYFNSLKEIKQAIDENRWLILNVFSPRETNMFSTGDLCFSIEIDKTKEYGTIHKVLSKNGKVGWIREQCLFKINSKKYKKIVVCECLE